VKHLFTGLAVAAAAAFTFVAGATSSAQAEELAATQPSHLYVGAGFFDVGDSSEEASAVFDVGYIPDYNLIWNIRPLVGAFVNTDGAVYGHVGFSRSIFFTDNFLTRLQVGFGAYGEGNSKDLGQVFEFREQIEFGWQFDNGDMISAYFWHLSNAGISEDNPGVNAAGLHYSMSF
jgi:hypothetical protein